MRILVWMGKLSPDLKLYSGKFVTINYVSLEPTHP